MEVGIILAYFSLFNALEAGEVEVPLNYVSSYFRTFPRTATSGSTFYVQFLFNNFLIFYPIVPKL